MQDNTENTSTSSPSLLSRGWEKVSWLNNKYLLASLLFLVWMFFFDPKDIGSAFNRWRKYKELQTSEKQLSQQIDDTKRERSQLKDNARTIEKYARENYLMKKDNEDLFIINEAKTGK